MRCPRCHAEMKVEGLGGIEIDRCPQCRGLWLDYPELDQLEDTVLDRDEVKGTLAYAQRPSDISCPKCQGQMTTFNYHAYNLSLDVCNKEHGFWLDEGEERRVLQLMGQRIKDVSRATAAEAEWAGFLRKLKSRSFLGRVKGLFR